MTWIIESKTKVKIIQYKRLMMPYLIVPYGQTVCEYVLDGFSMT